MSPGPSKSLARLAFAVSLLGVCFFPVCAIGGVLALVDSFRNHGQPTPAGFDYRRWAYSLQGISLVVSFCMVSALPTWFAENQQRKHDECREGLQAVMTRFTELQDGGVTLGQLVAAVPGHRRQLYTYVLGEGVTVPPRKDLPEEAERQRQLDLVRVLTQPGLRGTCPDCQLTVACVGNTDGDDELDLLSLSSAPRYASGRSPVSAGEVYVQSRDFAHDPEQGVGFEAPDGG